MLVQCDKLLMFGKCFWILCMGQTLRSVRQGSRPYNRSLVVDLMAVQDDVALVSHGCIVTRPPPKKDGLGLTQTVTSVAP